MAILSSLIKICDVKCLQKNSFPGFHLDFLYEATDTINYQLGNQFQNNSAMKKISIHIRVSSVLVF